MRILTPTEAAFSPSGPSSTSVSANAIVSQNITADTSYGPTTLYSAPESGPFLVVMYAEISATSAATGTLAANINNNGGPAASFSQSINTTTANTDAQFVTVFTDLNLTFEWSVTGFTTGDSDIKIVASIIKLF